MSTPPEQDPRWDSPAADDDAMLAAHERQLGAQPDHRARYRLAPLALLFVLSGFVLFAATYLNRYSGHFSASVYDENALPSTGEAAPAKADPVAAGRRLFNTAGACVTCHQPTGEGIPGVYPPLAGSEWVTGPAGRTIRIVLYGLKGPVHVKGADFPGSAAMPSFGSGGFGWSDEKIADVLTYVRQEWGNKAPPVSAEDVRKVRQVAGERREWSQEELLQAR